MTKDKLKKILITGMVIACICVCPLNLIRKESTLYPTLDLEYGISDGSVQELEQTFVAQTGYLSEIAFDIKFPVQKPEDGILSVSLCRIDGDKRRVITEKNISLQDVNNGAFTEVEIEKYIRKGKVYSVKITGDEKDKTGFAAIYTIKEEDSAPGSQVLYLDGKETEGQAVCAYAYKFPLNWKNVLCLWMFVGIVGFMLIETLCGDIFSERDVVRGKTITGMLDKYQFVILFIELAVIFLLVSRIARNEAVDWDESFTWNIVTKNNFSGMLKATAADVHPPLYYALVMAAMKIFGENIFVAKMVSVAGGFATALLGVTLIRKRWGVKTAILFLPVAGLAPQMLYYNLNLRMYSWMIFFVLAGALFAYEIMLSGKTCWWAAFTLVSLGGVYTQYFAVVPLAFIYLFLLGYCIAKDRGQVKKWIICSVATVVGYLPWLGVVAGMAKQDGIGEKSKEAFFDLAGLCKWAFECNIELSEYMPAVLFLVAAFCFVLERKKYTEKERKYLVLLGVLFFITYGACMVLQQRFSHFWSNRYVVDVLLFLWVFLLIIISKKSVLIWGMSTVWLGILMLSSYAIVQEMELKTIPWTTQAKQLLEQVQDEEKIVFNYPTFDTLYAYYLPEAEFVWYEDADFDELGDEFYMMSWGPEDFGWQLYENGILEKEVIGTVRLEEGVNGVELRKITFHRPTE